jgi:hypothetical protein
MNRKAWIAAFATLAALHLSACQGGGGDAAQFKEVTAQNAGAMRIAVLSESGELTQGQDRFVLAFTENGAPVDVGTVTVSASMSMPGMAPMVAPIELQRADDAGRYHLTGEFAMSGAWQFEVRWDGPAGQGGTAFNLSVR